MPGGAGRFRREIEKRLNKNRIFVNDKTTNEKTITLQREDIATLARELWQQEGSQSGRDWEYWLRAEQQILAAREQTNPAKNRSNSPAAMTEKKGRQTIGGTGQLQQARR